MRYTLVNNGILYIHVVGYAMVAAEEAADKNRDMPCIVWYDDGQEVEQIAPVYWSPCLTEKMLAVHREGRRWST